MLLWDRDSINYLHVYFVLFLMLSDKKEYISLNMKIFIGIQHELLELLFMMIQMLLFWKE